MDRQVSARAVKSSWKESLWGLHGTRLIAGDAAVIFFFAFLSFSFFFGFDRPGKESETVEVEVGGKSVLTIDRDMDGIHEVMGPLGTTRLEVRERRVRILSSPCPLKLGIKAGWIGTTGEMLVCLPNEVVVRLPGSFPSEVDAVSR